MRHLTILILASLLVSGSAHCSYNNDWAASKEAEKQAQKERDRQEVIRSGNSPGPFWDSNYVDRNFNR